MKQTVIVDGTSGIGAGVVRLHYFKGRGRAETTRWMLAANGIEFENVAIETPQALAELRASGKLPFDQMPLLEIDGLNLSQSSAMIRYLARKGDLYGDTDHDALWCDMITGAVADFAEAAIQAAFQPTRSTAEEMLKDRFVKFGPCFEACINRQAAGFCAARRLSFADIVLAEALSAYLEWIPDIMAHTPLLAALYDRVTAMPTIASYLASPQRYPMADHDYVISAARVLQRALPPHMPDPLRFVGT